MPRFMVRCPDHLGDGVMALPAIHALQAAGRVRLVGPKWAKALYGDHQTGAADNEIAVLFKPSWSAAWSARHHKTRIGLATDGRWPLLTRAVIPGGRHRVADYQAVARAAGAAPSGLPTFVGDDAIDPSHPPLPSNFVLMLPLTQSPRTAGWQGFGELAKRIGSDRVVFAAGPGEDAALRAMANASMVLPALGLGAFAVIARRAAVIIGNDSGLTHLAAAATRGASGDARKVHVVYGGTDPFHTGPPGTTPHHSAQPPCWPCYRKTCIFGSLAPCLDTQVATLQTAVQTSLQARL